MVYYRKLSNITAQIQKIGILYNQTVKAINSMLVQCKRDQSLQKTASRG